MTEINKKLRSGLLPAPMIIKNYVRLQKKTVSVRSVAHHQYLLEKNLSEQRQNLYQQKCVSLTITEKHLSAGTVENRERNIWRNLLCHILLFSILMLPHVLLHAELLNQRYLNIDETLVQVLKKRGERIRQYHICGYIVLSKAASNQSECMNISQVEVASTRRSF